MKQRRSKSKVWRQRARLLQQVAGPGGPAGSDLIDLTRLCWDYDMMKLCTWFQQVNLRHCRFLSKLLDLKLCSSWPVFSFPHGKINFPFSQVLKFCLECIYPQNFKWQSQPESVCLHPSAPQSRIVWTPRDEKAYIAQGRVFTFSSEGET